MGFNHIKICRESLKPSFVILEHKGNVICAKFSIIPSITCLSCGQLAQQLHFGKRMELDESWKEMDQRCLLVPDDYICITMTKVMNKRCIVESMASLSYSYFSFSTLGKLSLEETV